MSHNCFVVVLNLSNFFNDHRHRARIFITKDIRTVADLQNRITEVFCISNFILTSQNAYLPPSEDIRILHEEDIIWVIPSQINPKGFENIEVQNKKQLDVKTRKRKASLFYNVPDFEAGTSNNQERLCDEIEEDYITENTQKRKKKEKLVVKEKEETLCDEIEKGYNTEKPQKRKKEKLVVKEKEESVKKSKKKKNRGTEEIAELQPDELYIPKSSKKNKNIEEDTDKNKKQIENSLKKCQPETIDSKPKKNNYTETSLDTFQVTVGNGLSNTISYKKTTPIPTITDQYIKAKQINIVRIDHIPTPRSVNKIQKDQQVYAESFLVPNSAIIEGKKEQITENGDTQTLKPMDSLGTPNTNTVQNLNRSVNKIQKDHQVYAESFPVTNSIIIECKKEQTTENGDTQILKPMDSLGIPNTNTVQNLNSKSKVPTTKYFFLNTPSSKKKKEIEPKQKRSNMFKLRDENVLSKYMQTTFKSSGYHSISDNSKEKVENAEGGNSKEKVPRGRDNAIVIQDDKMIFETPRDVLLSASSENVNNSENTWKEAVEITGNEDSTKIIECTEVITNDLKSEKPEFVNAPSQNLELYPSLELTRILNESKHGDNTKEITLNYPLSNRESFESIIMHRSKMSISPDISGNLISQHVTATLDSPMNKSNDLGISGIQPINSGVIPRGFGKRSIKTKMLGVGTLLDSIRKSESCSVLDSSQGSEVNEFVTKRKKGHRVRRRKSKSIISTPGNTSEFLPVTPKPLMVDACPKMHIKFPDHEVQECDQSVQSVSSDEGDVEILEDNIFKAPRFTSDMEPKVDDIIAFKILRLSDAYNPCLSSYIIGRVKSFSPETKTLNLDITFGLDQFDASPDTGTAINPAIKICQWSDLKEARLLFP